MLEHEFYQWLLKYRGEARTANARRANCLRIEKYEGDLDDHYGLDNCASLLQKLIYSTDDQKNKRPAKHCIPVNGDIRNGTATLKSALSLYVSFRNGNNEVLRERSNVQREIKITIKKPIGKWPEWVLPSDEELYQLAQVATKYIRFLNPEIVGAIAEDNAKHQKEWSDKLESRSVNTSLYLWEGSSCCFPGIRRYAGSKEISYFTKHTQIDIKDIPNAIKLDGNDFPKQIWSFVFRGQQFNKYGPKNYSLAHLIDHKESNNRMNEEVVFANENKYVEPFYGLYTCPSNTVYIPNSLIKPTDFNLKLRKLLFLKAEELYTNSCNILPPLITIPKNSDSIWNIDRFTWGECVGTTQYLDSFLAYRYKMMNKLLLSVST
jgi:hypothetical protein